MIIHWFSSKNINAYINLFHNVSANKSWRYSMFILKGILVMLIIFPVNPLKCTHVMYMQTALSNELVCIHFCSDLETAAHYASLAGLIKGLACRCSSTTGFQWLLFLVTTFECARSELARSFTLTFSWNVPSWSVSHPRPTPNFKASDTGRPALLLGLLI